MNPRFWGRDVWAALHFVALGYPTEPTDADRAAYGAFFRAVGAVLPCESCRDGYARHLEATPVADGLGGRDALFAWTVRLHNAVNADLGKPEVSLERAYELVAEEGRRSARSSSSGRGVGAVGTVAIVVLLAAIAVAFAVALFGRRTSGTSSRR